MNLKGKCGGCCWHEAYNLMGNRVHRCVLTSHWEETRLSTPACSRYKPLGAEPMNRMSFAEFKEKCEAFNDEHLIPLGYVGCDCKDFTAAHVQDAAPCYHVEFNKPVTLEDGKTGERTELMIDYSPSETYDRKAAMLYENFDCMEQIPKEYKVKRHPEMKEQPPQFVYGYFSRLGDALKSTLKGNSLNLRKPKELYY